MLPVAGGGDEPAGDEAQPHEQVAVLGPAREQAQVVAHDGQHPEGEQGEHEDGHPLGALLVLLGDRRGVAPRRGGRRLRLGAALGGDAASLGGIFGASRHGDEDSLASWPEYWCSTITTASSTTWCSTWGSWGRSRWSTVTTPSTWTG